jgi:outer membrane receptor protein involved in Fe transport
MKIQILLIFLFTFLIQIINAQPSANNFPKGTISGNIIDANTKEKIEFASVQVYHLQDTSYTNGAMSNENGIFEINKLKFGTYKLIVKFIGYEKFELSNLKITSKTPDLKIGEIKLIPDNVLLSEVEVKTEKSLFEKRIDKKVYNIDQMPGVQGGTAADVMKNIPSVNMDDQGKINIRNNSNLQILIDGRPSNALESGLNNLPSSSIEKVEVITNPSAKYNPDGTSGIVNIILKKNRNKGVSGNITLGYGTLERYNSNLNLGYYNGKLNLFGSLSQRYNDEVVKVITARNYYNNNGIVMYQTSNNKGDNISRNYNARFGADYYINTKNSLSFSNSLVYNNGTNWEKQDYYTYNPFDLISYNNIANREFKDMISNDLNINYSKKFNQENQSLIVDFAMSNVAQDSKQNINNFLDLYIQDEYTSSYDSILNDEKRNTYVESIDYAQTLKNIIFESGLRFTQRNIKNTQPNTIDGNNAVQYNDNTNAAYITAGKKWNKWSSKLGLRFENFNRSFILNNDNNTYNKTFNDWFPTLAINYERKKGENISFNYSRRTNRPGMQNLNPSSDRSNQFSVRRGNPYLLPEYIHALEIGYNTYFKSFSINTNLYFTHTSQAFTRFASVDDNGAITITSANIGVQNQYGVEFISNGNLTKTTSITYSANVGRREIRGNKMTTSFNKENISFNTRINIAQKITNKIDAQVGAFYTSPFITPQGEILSRNNVDLSIRLKVIKNKGLITAGINDIFLGSVFRIQNSEINFNNTVKRIRASRYATISFNYRFGSGDMKSNKKPIRQQEQQQQSNDF